MSPFSKHNDGFTLLELITVVAIIGILSIIAIPAYSGFKDRAKIALVRADLRNIQYAMEMLASDTEKWPGPYTVGGKGAHKEVWDLSSDAAGLVSTNGEYPNWQGPYMESMPKDPWGQDYFLDPDYFIGGKKYPVLGSFGPNKVGQNQFDSDDIYLNLSTQ